MTGGRTWCTRTTAGAHAAIGLADQLDVPLVVTLHATEAGRHAGWLSSVVSQQVHSVEWWLAQRADALITCSEAMRTEAAELFDRDRGDISVLHNGIEPRRWRVRGAEVDAVRARYSRTAPRCCFYFGRLEYEKGVHDLIAALPRIRRAHPGTRLLVAGHGTHVDFLIEAGQGTPGAAGVQLLGHLPDRSWPRWSRRCTRWCCPAGTSRSAWSRWRRRPPERRWLASTAGGLGEVVRNGVTGRPSSQATWPASRPPCAPSWTTRMPPRPGPGRPAPAAQRVRLGPDRRGHRAGIRRRPPPPDRADRRPKIPTGNAFGP